MTVEDILWELSKPGLDKQTEVRVVCKTVEENEEALFTISSVDTSFGMVEVSVEPLGFRRSQ